MLYYLGIYAVRAGLPSPPIPHTPDIGTHPRRPPPAPADTTTSTVAVAIAIA